MTRVFLLITATVLILFGHASKTLACPQCHQASCCGPVCCYKPCIKYVDKARCRGCCDQGPPVHMVLQVKDPCTCCVVYVPVCVPACCIGAPCVDAKVGMLGNGKVFYTWNCGYEIKVVLTKRGDITVVYLGA